MKFDVQLIQHIEGVPDQSHYGFTTTSEAELNTVSNALDLITKTNIDGIFKDYEDRRDEVMEMILNDELVI